MMDWIEVEERLPEKNDIYLVTWTGTLGSKRTRPFIALVEYIPEDNEWCTFEIEGHGYKNIEVIAWMPVPDPYKKGES